MKLCLLRHAVAFPRDSAVFPDDSGRPLTREGKEDLRKAVLGMKALGLSFERVWCSPYLRARETAEVLAEVFKIKGKLFFHDLLKAEIPAQKVIRELQTKWQNVSSLLLVGHEPQLSDLLSCFLIGKPGLPVALKKSGMAQVEVSGKITPGSARLKWILTPKQLKMCAE